MNSLRQLVGVYNPFERLPLRRRNVRDLELHFGMSIDEIFNPLNSNSPAYYPRDYVGLGLDHEWAHFADHGGAPPWHEIFQGGSQDCAVVAALIACCFAEIPPLVEAADHDVSVNLYHPVTLAVTRVRISRNLRTEAGRLWDARAADQNPWPSFVEKAWLVHGHGQDWDRPFFAQLENREAAAPVFLALAGSCEELGPGTSWNRLSPAEESGKFKNPVVMWTRDDSEPSLPLVAGHAYAAIGVLPRSRSLVVVDPFSTPLPMDANEDWGSAEEELRASRYWSDCRNKRPSLIAVPRSEREHVCGFVTTKRAGGGAHRLLRWVRGRFPR